LDLACQIVQGIIAKCGT